MTSNREKTAKATDDKRETFINVIHHFLLSGWLLWVEAQQQQNN